MRIVFFRQIQSNPLPFFRGPLIKSLLAVENNETDPIPEPLPILDYGQPAEKPHPIGMKFPVASVASAIIVIISYWLPQGTGNQDPMWIGGKYLSLEGLIMGIVSVFAIKHQSKNAAAFLALAIIGIFLNGFLFLIQRM
jgi:hypothetical protein